MNSDEGLRVGHKDTQGAGLSWGSDGRESSCNVGDAAFDPGWEDTPGEGGRGCGANRMVIIDLEDEVIRFGSVKT